MINIQKNEKSFKDLVAKYITRDGIEDLMKWLESTDFFTAPASTRFHGSEPGGLCQHSINVGMRLFVIAGLLTPDVYTKESLCLVALFHDICKCNCYKLGTRNVKNESTGQWEKVPSYSWEEQQCYGGHGSKSVFLVQSFLRLSFEEAAAINSHMGFSDQSSMTAVSNAYEQNSLAWLLHVADEAATYLDKC